MKNSRQLRIGRLLEPMTEIPAPVKDRILYQANGMVGRAEICEEDMKDIVMEMAYQVLKAKNKVEESGGIITHSYLNGVVDNCRKECYRHRMCARRRLDVAKTSLDDSRFEGARHGDEPSLLERLMTDSGQMGAVECLAVRDLVAQLPPPYKTICESFMAGKSFEGIAKQLGLKSVTVRTYYWPKLKRLFIEGGFALD